MPAVGVSAMLSAIASYVADTIALVHDKDGNVRPLPDFARRYWGAGGMPQWQGTEGGYVDVVLERQFASVNFPANSGSSTTAPDGIGWIISDIAIRYVKCWKAAVAVEGGIIPVYELWDEDSAILSEISDVVTRALFSLTCVGRTMSAAYLEVLGQVSTCNGFAFVGAAPIPPKGGRAGVVWRVHAATLAAGNVS